MLGSILCSMFLVVAASAQTMSPEVVQEFRQRDQALLDAIAPGDVKVWDATFSDNAIYVDENGEKFSRSDFLKQLTPLPAGASGSLKILEYSATQIGDIVLVVHADDEQEIYHGQNLAAKYLMTETWQKQNGTWKLLLVHSSSVLQEPKPITLPESELDSYVGQYAAAPDLTYTIRREGDHLVGERNGRPASQLKAEVRDVFFVNGQLRTRKIFERDKAGKVIGFVDRREGSDIAWKRTK